MSHNLRGKVPLIQLDESFGWKRHQDGTGICATKSGSGKQAKEKTKLDFKKLVQGQKEFFFHFWKMVCKANVLV